MKKIAYFIASAAAFAILFTACNPETAKETVETVEVVSVVPETTNENAEALPEGAEGKDLFEDSVLPSLTSSITTLATSVKDSSVTSSNTRGVTFTDLSSAFAKFPESFTSKIDQTTGSMSFSGAWECPTGELDFGSDVKGLSASINALSVKIDAKSAIDAKTYKTDLGATGSAKAAASLAYTEAEDGTFELPIKKAKVNMLGYGSLNAAAVLNALEASSYSGNTRDADTTDEIAGTITEYLDALETLTGNIALYMGNSGAFYFEVPVEVGSESVTYNGVAKVDYLINVNKVITKDILDELSPMVSSLTEFMNSADDSQGTAQMPDYTKLLAKLDELELAEISYTFSVYDVKGNKLFDLYDVNTFEGLAEIIPSMMELTASLGEDD